MKKLFLALLMALSIAVSISAKTFSATGCTADHKAVSLGIDIKDDTLAAIRAGITAAFAKTAAAMSYEVLLSSEGFMAFVNSLSEEEYNAIDSLSGPPEITGECKQATVRR